MNVVDQRLDVSVSTGEFLGIQRPIAHIVLPTVVERDPHKSQAFSRWQRVIHLLRLNGPAISPRAPDGPESVSGRGGCVTALLHHELPSIAERTRIVFLATSDD